MTIAAVRTIIDSKAIFTFLTRALCLLGIVNAAFMAINANSGFSSALAIAGTVSYVFIITPPPRNNKFLKPRDIQSLFSWIMCIGSTLLMFYMFSHNQFCPYCFFNWIDSMLVFAAMYASLQLRSASYVAGLSLLCSIGLVIWISHDQQLQSSVNVSLMPIFGDTPTKIKDCPCQKTLTGGQNAIKK